MNRTVVLLGGAVTAILIAFAHGYGYHRDELYFIAAGHHLDWAYADQGPFTPLLARAMTSVDATSLTVLRVPSALAAGLIVVFTGLLAREMGGGRRAQAIAAACAATAAVVLFTGHLMSTSTFDLLAWTVVTWLAIRAIRTRDDRLWLVAGAVLGVGLLNKPLPAFLALGLLAGVAIAGPRRLLRSPYVWGGAAIALLLWSPWLIWQARHGWPQIDVSRSIAGGGSKSSQPWWSIVPFQLLLVSPVLAPVWIAGLVRLVRAPELRELRFVAWAWALLAVVFMATGGKPYYLAGLLPALIGAGAAPVDAWLERGRRRTRRALVVAALATSAAVGVVVALPILPARDAGPVIAMNGDVGETIGWPDLARTVARVTRGLPSAVHAVVFTSNYGEAGAIDRYGPRLDLPKAYSGHNAYADWGPPPAGAAPVVTVGLAPAYADAHFKRCALAAQVHNTAGVDNDEDGEAVMLCRGPRLPWSREWPRLRHLG